MTHPPIDALLAVPPEPHVLIHLDRCPRCRRDRDLVLSTVFAPSEVGATLTGRTVLGVVRFEVLGSIGRGGMGEVYRARDEELDRPVALKVLRADLGDPWRDAFLEEARTTARLQHPAVVPVHRLGQLDDGRPFYTMREVRGATLRSLVGELPLAALVLALWRVAEAVAYAHAQGVVHRDLKPDNVRIGDFDELTILDWGLAARIGSSPGRAGTRGYTAPEQERAEPAAPAADVWSLGAVLLELLTGERPRPDRAPEGPPELTGLCVAAMDVDPAARPTAAGFAAVLRDWLEGARRAEEARARIPGALGLLRAAGEVRAAADRSRQEAEALLAALPPAAPVAEKRAGWALLDRAAELDRRASEAELDHELALGRILELDPTQREARDLLFDLRRRQLEAAEGRADARESGRLARLLAADPRGAAWLGAPATVELRTRPAGLWVALGRTEVVDRRRVVVPATPLGATPLREVTAAPGPAVLRISAPDGDLDLPVVLPRGERWTLRRPGDLGPTHLIVPPAAPGARWVPAGWTPVGGDPHAHDALSAREVWVDGFHCQVHPVTLEEYVVFLNDIDPERAEAHQPREDVGYGTVPRPVLRRTGARFEAEGLARESAWLPDAPVVLIDSGDAEAYAAWWSARTGRPWGLPHELEWERAARGADRRVYPWGDELDPTFCNMVSSLPRPGWTSVHAFPDDVSPFGIRGLGGNVRDLCANAWTAQGDAAGGEALAPRAAGPDELRVVRGGMFAGAPPTCRSAARFGTGPKNRATAFGFRLVCREAWAPGTPGPDRDLSSWSRGGAAR